MVSFRRRVGVSISVRLASEQSVAAGVLTTALSRVTQVISSFVASEGGMYDHTTATVSVPF